MDDIVFVLIAVNFVLTFLGQFVIPPEVVGHGRRPRVCIQPQLCRIRGREEYVQWRDPQTVSETGLYLCCQVGDGSLN